MKRANLGEQSPTQRTYLNRVKILNNKLADIFIEGTNPCS